MANQDPALKATLLFLTALSLQFLTPLSLHFLYTWLATAWTCPLELQDGDTGSFLCPEPHKVLFDFKMTSMLISPKKFYAPIKRLGCLDDSDHKEPACSAGDVGSIPG